MLLVSGPEVPAMELAPWLGEPIEMQAQLPIVPEAVTWLSASAAGAIILALLIAGLVSLSRPGTAMRRFWCPVAERDVEVEFGTRGFGRLAAVRRCRELALRGGGAWVGGCVVGGSRRLWAVGLRGGGDGRLAA
jgi:hypothetical protein